MIYIFTIIILCILIFVFDLGKGTKKNADTCYKLMMFWFIALSGFAYNVGSDTVVYMEEYEYAVWHSVHNLDDFLNYEVARQPGWLLLEFLCRSICSSFVFFKLIIAFFGNWAVFRFIKKHSSYLFISVLFYGLVFALHLNFNALRQFVAVGFFLVGYDYLVEKKWLKYYLFVFLAYMFHSSAIICAIFPLLSSLRLNKKRVIILGVFFIAGSFALLSLDMIDLVGGILFSNADLLSESLLERSEGYFGDNLESLSWSIFGMLRVAFFVTIYFLILFFNVSKEKTRNIDNSLYLIFLLMYILNFCVPVLFFRFLFYVQPVFICLLPNAVTRLAEYFNTIKPVVVVLLLMLLSIEPVSSLFYVSEKRDVPVIVQYNPYYSVFNPKIDPVRNKYFGSYQK